MTTRLLWLLALTCCLLLCNTATERYDPPSPDTAFNFSVGTSKVCDYEVHITSFFEHFIRSSKTITFSKARSFLNLANPFHLDDSSCDFFRIVTDDAMKPSKNATQAVLMTVSNAQRAESNLLRWPLHILTRIMYCIKYGYDLIVYVHQKKMPSMMSGHFSKVPGAYKALFVLNYEAILFQDWDSFMAPQTAMPLNAFLLQWPAAGLFIQAEEIGPCSCVLMYRRNKASADLLINWWKTAVEKNCCTWHLVDQVPLDHIICSYLEHECGLEGMYKNGTEALYKEQKAADCNVISAWTKDFGRCSRETMTIGLLGSPSESSHVAPLNMVTCMGLWPGCSKKEIPALVYHHGHNTPHIRGNWEKMQSSILDSIALWAASRAEMQAAQ